MLPHRRKSKPESLTTVVRLARASSAAAATVVAVISSSSPSTCLDLCRRYSGGDESHLFNDYDCGVGGMFYDILSLLTL